MNLADATILVTGGWINGQARPGVSTFEVTNPATGDVIAPVSDLGAADTVDAIDAAAAALSDWKSSSAETRIAAMHAWADAIDTHAADLAAIVCAESGKPLREASGEVGQCAALLRWFAECIPNLAGDTVSESDQQTNYTVKQPVGVVACITPWNFPAAAVAVKAGAAIAAGCTTVIKPSDETPLIALALARLANASGIPAGVINVVPCKDPAAVGDVLCQSPTVRMLSFTGSTRTGRHLYAACAGTVKRVALELGGNAPFVVFDDADLDTAVDGAMGARFYNSGQICVGANRYLVHESIYDEFAKRLADRASELTPGSGDDSASDIGPMINDAAIDRLQDVVATSQSMGATVLTGGQSIGDSLFFEPTVISGMTPDMPASNTEIFGPVACLYSFSTDDEALQMANATEAGLSAYVYTQDADRLQRFSESLEAGVVGANSAMIFANDLPFGGIKQSGIGREHGRDCLDEYIEIKSICRGAI